MKYSTLAITAAAFILLENQTVYAGRNRRDGGGGGGNNNANLTPADQGFFNLPAYQDLFADEKLD